MKYQIQYWLMSGEMINIDGTVYAPVAARVSNDVQSLIDFSKSLDSYYGFSILEILSDGSLTPYKV